MAKIPDEGYGARTGAIILAGGRSSRMGQNKALLPFRGRPLIEHIRDRLMQSGFSPVLISGTLDGYSTIPDEIGQKGPVAGIHAALQHVQAIPAPRSWIFMPVDMPLLTAELLQRLVGCACQPLCDGAIFSGKPLPLFLRLDDAVLNIVNQAAIRLAEGGNLAVADIISHLRLCSADYDQQEEGFFLNANSPQEWLEVAR